MTHYRMQDNMPSAIILAKNPRTSSLDELKSYQSNTIYLNNGDEFQIRLFNPLREKIGVQIGMNGDLSQSLLVLNPGEDVTLDRFLDDKSKMLFETYVYDASNKAAANAVAENGNIQVNFFKEKKKHLPHYTNSRIMKSSSRGISGQQVNSSGSYDTTYATLRNVAGMGDVTLTGSNVFFSQSLDSDDGDITLDGDVTTNVNLNINSPGVFYEEKDLSFASDPIPEEKKETGRVEKGNESTQHFNEVQVEFEHFSFHTVYYDLKPTSERGTTTITESKQVRDYCPECGYRIRNTRWNFCPKCGDEV